MIRVVTLPETPKWKSPKVWIELLDDNQNVLATGTIYPPKTITSTLEQAEGTDPILYGIYRMLWIKRFYSEVMKNGANNE